MGLNRCLRALACALALCLPTWAAQPQPDMPALYYQASKFYQQRGRELGDKYELKESRDVPQWARDEPEPLWQFVHMTDTHYRRGLRPLLVQALQFIDARVRPRFVVLTGDIAPLTLQPELKALFDKHLHARLFAIRGDNWPQGFGKTFGDADWCFTYGGLACIGMSLDRDILNVGIGVFEPETHEWLAARLDEHKARPTLLFLHENIMPPSFLDAPLLRQQIEARGHVVATVSGHLHYDVDTRVGGIAHLVGPGFGPHREHPFKVHNVHQDHITVRTVKWRDGRFEYVCLYQRIDFPPGFALSPPASAPERERWLAVAGYQAPPPREVVFDPSLAERVLELLPHLMAYVPLTGRDAEIWTDLGELILEINKALIEQPAAPRK